MPALNPFKQLRKRSPNQRTNLLPPKLDVYMDRPNCWIAFCEYGKVTITSEDKLLRMTVSKKGGKYAQHLTAKFDKYNNFRVYYANDKGVIDTVYKYSYQYSGFIHQMLSSITHVRKNGEGLDKVSYEYEQRFFDIFLKGEVPINGRNQPTPIREYIWSLIYPLNSLENGIKGKVPSFIRRAIRSHDPKELTRKLFGKAPKSLTKAVIEHLPLDEEAINALFLAKVFYGIWPLDKVVEFLNYKPRDARKNFIFSNNGFMYGPRLNGGRGMVTHINQWRKFFRQFTYHKVLNWYKNYSKDFGHFTKDTLYPLKQLEQNGIKVVISKKMDIQQIHDTVAKHFRRMKRPEEALPVYDNLYELNNKKIDKYDIFYPKTNYDLIDWGEHLHNCVAGYDKRVINGRSIIFSLQDNGTTEYCVELCLTGNDKKFSLIQCSGKHNRSSSPVIKDKIRKLVESVFKSDKMKKPKLIFPEGHKIEAKDITDYIDLEALAKMDVDDPQRLLPVAFRDIPEAIPVAVEGWVEEDNDF